MTRRFSLILGALTLSCLMAQVTSQVQLVAEPLAKEYKVGSEIQVRMRLQNHSKEPLHYVRFGGTYDYTILVGDGVNEAPKTEKGLGLWTTYIPISARSETLDPKGEFSEVIDIAEIYKLEPGHYKAYVSRRIVDRNDPKKENRVYSEVFTFDVIR